ncbi:MAG: amino acid ABC transporter substrate-binding protein, partial [Parvibaculales bacterium]
MRLIATFMFFGLSFATLSAQAAESTLENVRERGFVRCGVSQGLPGFSYPDNRGNWRGLDVDLCRAVAVAIFGKKNAVRFVPVSSKERWTMLQSGEADILSRNTTWTMQRDTALGARFLVVNYYDGQGFMVRKDLGIKHAEELDGASICTNSGTTTELNAADYFRSRKIAYELVTFEKADEAVAAYDSGRCDAYTTDHSALYAHRLRLANPKDHIVLPDIISKEPLGPVVRQGDSQWESIVRWSFWAMLNAEELGVSSRNLRRMYSSNDPAIARLLGRESDFGRVLGLSPDWAAQIIRQIGNYAESFERNVGMGSPLKIERGNNALWTNGGLLY